MKDMKDKKLIQYGKLHNVIGRRITDLLNRCHYRAHITVEIDGVKCVYSEAEFRALLLIIADTCLHSIDEAYALVDRIKVCLDNNVKADISPYGIISEAVSSGFLDTNRKLHETYLKRRLAIQDKERLLEEYMVEKRNKQERNSS